MPPRHHYWTIILEGKPTAFRAHTQEELMPTLRQLQARHPDAVLKWFARGRLWETQEAERADAVARRQRTRPAGERRGRDWRPGGEHQDPRDRFNVPRDEKRRRFAANLRRDREAPRQQDPRGGSPAVPKEARFDKQQPPSRSARFDRPSPLNRPPRGDRSGRSDRPPQRFNRPPQADGKSGSDRPPRFDRAGKPPWKRENESGRDRERPGSTRSHGPAKRFGKPHGAPPRGGRKPGGGGKSGGGGGGGRG